MQLKKIILIILIYTLSLSVYANDWKVDKEEVSFSNYWLEAEVYKNQYQCDYEKVNNPAFEFIFLVLQVESTKGDDTFNYPVLSQHSKKIINDNDLHKNTFQNSQPEVICLTDTHAIVLHKFLGDISSDNIAHGRIMLSQYDFVKEDNKVKLKVYENQRVNQFNMSRTLESSIFLNINLGNAL